MPYKVIRDRFRMRLFVRAEEWHLGGGDRRHVDGTMRRVVLA
jgi:hypothetical protein